LKQFATPKSKVTAAVIGRNDDEVITGGDDGVVRVWSIPTGKEVKGVPMPKAAITSLAFRPSPGFQVVTASQDKALKVLDLGSGKEVRALPGLTAPATAVVVPNALLALTAGPDGFRLWQIDAGKMVKHFNDHKGPVLALAVSPNGRWVASGGADNRILLWNLGNQHLVRSFDGHAGVVNGLAFSLDSNYLLSASADKSVRLWGVPTGQ